ncbi:hypothetical protein M427DRAFT_51404 [Gonapodya prolifera JEL478]|uniref:Ubiquitin-like domain-containing protein n=1 Tax=Gonapodya prolifera (strain JEL478) TaxID=1344416 RepID=A0A139AWL1_GONPJ|nr:hypothetical protein M427DRAFT_51404 [Gonapodya prolifera JEL478]|eukprot:KXS21131.1 hypothetical protein M427DRAFT_51404 [Gonapodya prolifera JEL478]
MEGRVDEPMQSLQVRQSPLHPPETVSEDNGRRFLDRGKAIVRDPPPANEDNPRKDTIELCIRSVSDEDFVVELPSQGGASVRDLKLLIEHDHPNHPEAGKQTLVYGGRVLRDNDFIGDILKRASLETRQTIILVSRGAATPRDVSSSQRSTNREPSALDTSQPQTTPSSTLPVHSSPNAAFSEASALPQTLQPTGFSPHIVTLGGLPYVIANVPISSLAYWPVAPGFYPPFIATGFSHLAQPLQTPQHANVTTPSQDHNVTQPAPQRNPPLADIQQAAQNDAFRNILWNPQEVLLAHAREAAARLRAVLPGDLVAANPFVHVMLLVRLVFVVYLFGQNASTDRFALLLFSAFLVYVLQTGVLRIDTITGWDGWRKLRDFILGLEARPVAENTPENQNSNETAAPPHRPNDGAPGTSLPQRLLRDTLAVVYTFVLSLLPNLDPFLFGQQDIPQIPDDVEL